MNKRISSTILIGLFYFLACKGKADTAEEPAAVETRTPVTVENIQFTDLSDSIELNATSTFLQNNYVKATATGYVKSVNAKLGQFVKDGEPLFGIVTKESLVIGNSISSLDTSLKFTGKNTIKSTAHGFITQLNHQTGDYVQDGEQLAVISDMNSFAFLLNLPYELRSLVLNQNKVDLTLPDGTKLTGTVASVMPTVDSLTQTQPVVIKVNSKTQIPQNLIAKVKILKQTVRNAQILPKSAILSDESQTEFWVMKLLDSSTAAKVNVEKGLELKGKVEIIKPIFTRSDLFITSGNYGLPDTAHVIVEKQQ